MDRSALSGAVEGDTTPVSRAGPGAERDLESQRQHGERPDGAPSRLMPQLRSAIPSWLGVTASRRPDQCPTADTRGARDMAESPKSTLFRISEQTLPSPRLHMPGLTRTWTPGSSRPPSSRSRLSSRSRPPSRPRSDQSLYGEVRPGDGGYAAEVPGLAVTAPVPVVSVDHFRRHRSDVTEVDDGHDGHGGARCRFRGVDPAEAHLAELVDDGRRRRRHGRSRSTQTHRSLGARPSNASGGRSIGSQHDPDREDRRRRRRRRRGLHATIFSGSARGLRQRDRGATRATMQPPRPVPRHFLFCFPWIKSQRVRNQILQCLVAGLLLALLLGIYLALSMTRNINNSEFTVLLVLIILFVTIFFCQGLIRLCMVVVRNQRGGGLSLDDDDEDLDPARGSSSRRRPPQMAGLGGYAIPRQPIRVVLARDEEAAGLESETTKMSPPAYGLWRESVRVDPNRIYWARNEAAATGSGAVAAAHGLPTTRGGGEGAGGRVDSQGTPRPPSYASDDGVAYVVEAQPRSMAPMTDVSLTSGPLAHSSETGRAGRPAGVVSWR